jgi:pimeloyl-ACP methyl ester carboxylesterase
MLVATLASGCTFTSPPTCPRPALALPASVPPARELAAARLETLTEHGRGRASGTLCTDTETIAFELRRQPEGRPRALVLLVPILAGGAELMESVANRMVGHGFDVAWCARAGGAMRPGQRAADLDELFRRTVEHQRLLLAWLRGGDQPPPAIFALGMSLGGMVATVLAAEEPSLAGVAICLSGGDIAGLIASSSEPRVQRWRRWRLEADGIGDDHLQWELAEFLHHDPLRFAPAIATGRVILVEAEFDTVIPGPHRALLWEALGRPARLKVPFGHYSAALAIDPILSAVADHFTRQLPSPASLAAEVTPR